MNSMKMTMAAVLLATVAAPVRGQLASPSTAALGMGDNYTAAARGYSAVSWNPALLGLDRGNPAWSMTLFTGRGVAGLDPVTLGDLKDYEDEVVPANVKAQWLASIRDEGSQAGTGGADITWLALQVGNFGLQASSSAQAVSDISPGIAELLLFGNADEQGNAKTISLSGSTLNVNAFTTVGASYGHSVTIGGQAEPARLSFGVTGKYTVGHFMAISRESTGEATADPARVDLSFPMLHTPMEGDDDEFEGNSGRGFGLDVGAAWETRTLTLGATVQNIVNTFEWDEELLRYRAGTILFSREERSAHFERQPVSDAPAALRGLVEDMKFEPSVALGALLRASERLHVSADARFGGTAGMSTRPATQIGAGAEFRILPFLPVRAGAAFVKLNDDASGFQLGGGVGLELGALNISASALRRDTDLGVDTIWMLTLLSLGI